MPTSLLETKLYVPSREVVLVPRPRRRERLDRRTAPKMILVPAPAGFGKTTLLAQWVVGRPLPSDERSVPWL